MKRNICGWLAAGLATVAVLPAAFAPGGTAYTKRTETALLAEPQMLAPPVTRVGYGRPLRIEAVKGAWVRVNEGTKAGWVFAGNLADEKPSEKEGLDGLPFAASETTAAAAARPLLPAAEEYSTRRGLTRPADDMTWLAQQQARITPDEVQAFLREQKKGEYQ